jgi:hypothetical protein
VERQENSSVVICVEYPQNRPPSKLDDLSTKKRLSHKSWSHGEME